MKDAGRKILLAAAALLVAVMAYADGGTYTSFSPYTKYGLGNIFPSETAFTASMGGIGVAMRNNKFINVTNPAAVTARDSLAFMGDFGIVQNNSYYKQAFANGANISSAHNTFNIGNFVMSFPIWKSSAFMIGICPYGNVGYDFHMIETDQQSIGLIGNIKDQYTGIGSLYQLYVGAGVTFWKRLSFGAQFDYYFGNIEKSSQRTYNSTSFAGIYYGNQMYLKGFGCKFGLQYEQPLNNDRLVFGVTGRIPTRIKGDNMEVMYIQQSSVLTGLDTAHVALNSLSIPAEICAGISYTHEEKFTAEVNYSYADWRNSGMDKVSGFALDNFTSSVAQRVNVGFEYTPNRSDIRYYMKRVSYRMGAYYKQDYFKYSGHIVGDWGITAGATFPIFRWYNGITIGLIYGQRGSLKNPSQNYSPILERYFKITASFNIFDIWFIKPKYE